MRSALCASCLRRRGARCAQVEHVSTTDGKLRRLTSEEAGAADVQKVRARGLARACVGVGVGVGVGGWGGGCMGGA
jgi:hypothetical protein